jgi:hypothetical protein
MQDEEEGGGSSSSSSNRTPWLEPAAASAMAASPLDVSLATTAANDPWSLDFATGAVSEAERMRRELVELRTERDHLSTLNATLETELTQVAAELSFHLDSPLA